MISYNNGISIDGLPFPLDPSRVCDLAYVSHAHSDHARPHKKVIATPETALLINRCHKPVRERVIPFGRRVRFGNSIVELFPSGHMLGAAQILVETKRHRIVYTGDFKIYPNLTCPQVETRSCDILVMESTYGDPAYSFPPQNEVYARIIMFIKRAIADKYIPILVCYAMGKSQEAIKLLQRHKFKVAVDSQVEHVTACYRAAGVDIAVPENLSRTAIHDKVLVVTPQTLRHPEFKAIRRKRSLFLSGWSRGKRKFTSGADLAMPLSDHADFTQLLSYIDNCKPSKILTLHGPEKFARILREKGYNAHYLSKGFVAEIDPTKQLIPKPTAPSGENYELF